MFSRTVRYLRLTPFQGLLSPSAPPSRCASAIVFRRTFEPPLVKGKNVTQEKLDSSVPDDPIYLRYLVLEKESEVEATAPPIKIVLMKAIEEYGKKGQILTMASEKAHKELLYHGLAVYASPANLEELGDIVIPENSVQFSSPSIQKALPKLSKTVCPLVLHGVTPWTIERWHVRLALMQSGVFVVDDESVSIHSNPINGPNPDLQGKEFLARLKVNDLENVSFRCVIYHHSIPDEGPEVEGLDLTQPSVQVPPLGWEHMFNEPVFEEERKELSLIPRHPMDEKMVAANPSLKKHLELYNEWRVRRDAELFS